MQDVNKNCKINTIISESETATGKELLDECLKEREKEVTKIK